MTHYTISGHSRGLPKCGSVGPTVGNGPDAQRGFGPTTDSALRATRKMTLLVVMPSGELRGGAEVALLHALASPAGVEWHVALLEAGSLEHRIRAMGVGVTVLPAGRLRHATTTARCIRALARLAKHLEASAVLGWMTKAHLYGGPAAWLAGVPAVRFQQGLPENGWIDRLARRLPTAGVLGCSRYVADAEARAGSHAPRAVHPGVDPSRYDPAQLPTPAAARRRLGLPGDGPLVGIVARLQRWKGVHVLVEAMPQVLGRHPSARCVIVGGRHDLEPEYEPFLREQIEQLGLADRVLMVGSQPNVPEWMTAMDVVVHASDCEPFGLVVIEAMALGRPTIATVPGGPAEIITPGVDGQLVPHGDAAALAAAIDRYLSDPAYAAACGSAARTAAGRFPAETFGLRVAQALREVISCTD